MITDPPPTPFHRAKAELRRLGVELVSTPGAYRFRYLSQGAAAALLPEEADDLEQAVKIGRQLAKRAPPERLAPLGAMGGLKSRRGAMIKHNRKIAARRRRGKVKDGKSENVGTRSAAKPSGIYLATIEAFAEEWDCTGPETLADLADVQEIAARFEKTPIEVARDINRAYVASYRPLTSQRLNLLDPDSDKDD